jgi:gas vesicle protein
MNNDSSAKTDSTFWVGLFLGGLIGAILIVVLGTEKGKKLAAKLQKEGFDWLEETKSEVNEKVGQRLEQFEEKRQELVEKGEELVKSGKKLQAEIADTVTDGRTDLVETVVEKVDETLSHIEKLQERGRQATATLRKNLVFKSIPKK